MARGLAICAGDANLLRTFTERGVGYRMPQPSDS